MELQATGRDKDAAARGGDGTLRKALALLDAVAAAEGPVRFAELLRRTSMPKATLHRTLRNLTEEGMLARDPLTQTYSLGPRLIRLAHAAWSRSGLAKAARPVLDDLSRTFDATFHLAQLDAGHVLYLDKRRGAGAARLYSSVGKVGPAYCTGVGKAMLAFLAEDALEEALARQALHPHTEATITDMAALRTELAATRRRGYAIDREEHEPGVICVAAPVVSASGALYGALSATGSTHLTTIESLERLAPRIVEAAREIAAEAEITLSPTL